MNKRIKQIGCHLTAQEFYEKIFLALWFWMIILMITTSAYIIFLSLFLLDFARFRIIRALSNHNAEKLDLTIENATQGFTVADWFLLYKLRIAFFNRGFFNLLLLYFITKSFHGIFLINSSKSLLEKTLFFFLFSLVCR